MSEADSTTPAPGPRVLASGCRLWVGTSGYNYPEWKGSFYPAKLPASQMLAYYSARFPTVEINYTFYRMPNPKVLAGWADTTGAAFRFTLKAPRRITHEAKLRGCEDLLRVFCERAATLDQRLGVLLFQLPPTFAKDVAALAEFLEWLPRGTRAAFEFRHASWHDDEVFDRLRAAGVALCIADSERMSTPVVSTAPYGYFRLRDEGYQESDLRRWAQAVADRCADWADVFVYFKHEETGKGPEFARTLLDLLPA